MVGMTQIPQTFDPTNILQFTEFKNKYHFNNLHRQQDRLTLLS